MEVRFEQYYGMCDIMRRRAVDSLNTSYRSDYPEHKKAAFFSITNDIEQMPAFIHFHLLF